MKRFQIIQITAITAVFCLLGSMFILTGAYSDVENRVVRTLCLSCIKLEPKLEVDFTFETVENKKHPNFVLENLSKGPVFLHFSEDACYGCDVMYPIIKDLFGVEFAKDEIFYETVDFEDSKITHIYVNIDHTTEMLADSFFTYDVKDVGGLPMFTIITLNYDRGVVKPYLASLYGTLGFDNDNERLEFFQELISESIDLYNQNSEGYSN